VYHVPGMSADLYIDADLGKSDRIKKELMKGVAWESHIGKLIRRYTKKGSVAVDVGSHIGTHTIAMSRAVGAKGAVHSFEPQKKMCAEQWKNLEINSCNNVFLRRKALGDRAKKMQMGVYDCKNEGSRQVLDIEGGAECGEEVDMITLDSLGLENVSLIKADIEYYEYMLFKGAKETIRRCRPVVIFELFPNPPRKGRVPEDVTASAMSSKKLLESHGYTVKYCFKSYPYDADPINFIGFPTEKMAQLKKEANKGRRRGKGIRKRR